MKITQIETYHTTSSLALVRVRTDDGAEGWGQTSAYLADHAVQVLHSVLTKWFLGRDPWDLEAITAELVRTEYKYWGTLLFRGLCGIDTAVWDLLGQVTGLPVYRLIGGAVRTSIPVYGSSMARQLTAQQEIERMQALREQHGFEAFKLRVARPMGEDTEAWPGRDVDMITSVRQALGDDVDLMADANGGYSAGKAIAVGRILEDHGYFHFEEPCPYDRIELTQQVAAALDIPIAGGEQDYSIPQWQRIIAGQVVDIVQPDIGYLGGLGRARKVAWTAEAAGIPVTPHCANRSLLQVFTLHLAAASPAATQRQEWSIEETDWTKDLFEGLPEVHNGRVQLSERPGWGISVDADFVAKAERHVSRQQ